MSGQDTPAGNGDCGCCAGVDADTPARVHNPPGLSAIAWRVGRHGDFLASMQARLSSTDTPALAALGTREMSDFSLALADAMATSLDVLSFYTERYAQEHYLRTATERLSVREMARLIGYRLAPGVAASTHLAFKLLEAPGAAPPEPIQIPVGTRVQSVPGQDETAQSFETVAEVPARVQWNAMPVQTRVPWRPQSGDTELWLDGLATQLQPGDAILIVGSDRVSDPGGEHWDVRVLSAVLPDNANARTRVLWNHPLGSAFPTMSPAGVGVEVHAFRQRTALFGHNAPDPNLLSGRGSNLAQKIDRSTPSNWTWKQFHINGTTVDLESANPKITAGTWFALVSNEAGLGSADLPGYTELYRAQRVSQLSRNDFGISGKTTRITPDTTENLSAARFGLRNTLVLAQSERLATVDTPLFHPVQGDTLTLGQRVDGLLPGQALAVSGTRQRIAIAAGAKGLSLLLTQGGSVALNEGDELFMTAPASRLVGLTAITLGAEAFTALLGQPSARLRLALTDRDGHSGTLMAQGHELRLAPARKDDPLVREIAHIADTGQAVLLERDHTQLKLDAALRHVYERASVRINGNVAPATHGETVEALLGNGDAGSAGQRFVLNQAPLTYVSAPTPSGGASTLELRVADVLWTEAPTLYQASPGARVYQTRQDDDGLTTVEFGDGVEGARLPSGQSNVRARYRKGLGVAGNVAAGQLTTLLSRPLGVSEVVNPEPATGGEDGELLERARENAPLTVLTLDRAVSITDYASFARAFAGIDKAHALWIPAGPAQGVFLTIAGVDGAVVPPSGATFASLGAALRNHGDALVPLHLRNHLGVRFRVRLSVKVLASHETDPVLQALEAALRAHFSFARRQFGQTVSVDEVAAVAQAVAGVQAVHVTRLHRVGQAPGLLPRLFAALPVASLTGQPLPAELLTLADEPVELEVMP
ncbi:MAG TPA: putative baseplate assembly protein [Hydrogenophaga sp.]|uniref:putative baseplate assembly protein n=1 Tax=Hydrogenophaga sp. TaxID=1904254 RepID=UPI0008C4B818|nr:putative baseplate assembly protein [Hydrogenophaga sp.]OGA79457.1 MAG: putative baseplate assembly protein [Burkholderiales bacterium GWE1_65_30]HAX20739.1 putative baseplate assembly protein [Hydrogenophaga sp.]HBU17938.1 putative baseplate assembly protein [Hydrogenophaga sp.]